MNKTANFTPTHRVAVEALCSDLSRRVYCAVVADYGQAEDGQPQDVALCVDSLPPGAWGRPGPLVTLLTDATTGDAFTVLAADGSPLVVDVGLPQALHAARFAAVREYQAMTEGALKIEQDETWARQA